MADTPVNPPAKVLPASPAPNRATQTPAVFSDNADAWAGSLPAFTNYIEAAGDNVFQNATVAFNAAEKSDAALQFANYRGVWDQLTGALDIPASVFWDGKIWALLESVPDVAAVEPGVDPVWYLTGFNDPIITLSGTQGTAGQAILSQGAGLPPVYGDVESFGVGEVLITSETLPAPKWLPLDGSSYLRSAYPLIENKFDHLAPFSSVSSGLGSEQVNAGDYDGGGTCIVVATGGKAARSTDNGATFTLITGVFSTTHLRGICHVKDEIWVVVGNGGNAWRSVDGGVNWSTLDTLGVTDNLFRVATDKDQVLLIGGGNSRLLRSVNEGATWSTLSVGSIGSLTEIETDRDGAWVVGSPGSTTILRSTDNGASFSSSTLPIACATGIDTDGDGKWILGAAAGQALVSLDNGLSWAVDAGLGFKDVSTIMSIKTNRKGLWIIGGPASSGLPRISHDNGATFSGLASMRNNTGGIGNDGGSSWLLCGSGGGLFVSIPDPDQFTIPRLVAPSPVAAYINTGESA